MMEVVSGSHSGMELKAIIDQMHKVAIIEGTERAIIQKIHTIPTDKGDLKRAFLEHIRAKALDLANNGYARLSLDELSFANEESSDWISHALNINNIEAWADAILLFYNAELNIQAAKYGVVIN